MMTAREKVWVECGRVVRSWGIRGALLVSWLRLECPVECGDGTVYVKRGADDYQPLRVTHSRKHGAYHVVMFDGISSRNEADELRGATFFLPEDDLPELEENEFYSYQILGLTVVTEDGEVIGSVAKIFTAGEHDVYVVKGEKDGKPTEIMIPAVEHVVRNVDIESGKITIRAIEGLLE